MRTVRNLVERLAARGRARRVRSEPRGGVSPVLLAAGLALGGALLLPSLSNGEELDAAAAAAACAPADAAPAPAGR